MSDCLIWTSSIATNSRFSGDVSICLIAKRSFCVQTNSCGRSWYVSGSSYCLSSNECLVPFVVSASEGCICLHT
uniref:Uncharacterized protein n=1 Tax=Arundo donax TaxID=35708 RepID=A0A0A9BER2_ARUDO